MNIEKTYPLFEKYFLQVLLHDIYFGTVAYKVFYMNA